MKDNTKSRTTEISEQSQPFFARFLEGQETSKSSAQTLKFPSDRDEVVWYTPGNNEPQR